MRARFATAASVIVLSAVALGGCGKKEAAPAAKGAAPASTAAAEDPNAAFDSLVDGLTCDYFAAFPEQATYYGAPPALAGEGADARLNDRSVAGETKTRAMLEASLAKVQAVDAAGLDARRAQIRDVLAEQYAAMLAPARVADYGGVGAVYGSWYAAYAAIQNAGPVVDVPNLMQTQQKASTPAEAEAFLARLAAFGPALDGVVAKLAADEAKGVVAPDFILAKTGAVIAAFIAPAPEKNPLVVEFARKLAAAKVAGADAYVARAAKTLGEVVYPAEKRLHAALEAQKKKAVHDAGIWRLPQGTALYQAMIRQMTDTDMTADAIHQKGLDEVARITGEMDAILKANGYAAGTVGARMTKLGEEKR
ncbi:MAG: DUF885 domain-containing protein, partial [Parvularculaceae bacterium]|nr:DUF885 domain-containing protein [Parvularculaceae bacterium]